MSSNYWTKLQDQEDTIVGSVKNSLMQLLTMDPNLWSADKGTKELANLEKYLTNLANGILSNITQNNKTTFPFPTIVKVGLMLHANASTGNKWQPLLDVTLDYA